MSPRILISGCNESRFDYENAVVQCGGRPESFYVPPVDLSCDGLILCGGNDVSPFFYGQSTHFCGELDEVRDQREMELLRCFMDLQKPVLGICRGMQLINVALGGDLKQDIGEYLHLFHSAWGEPDYRVHPIRTKDGSQLRRTYGETFMVNSCHHQALDHLGTGLRAVAWAESGIIEALEHESLPVFGVQFHPEKMCFTKRRADTVDGALIFRQFMEFCGLT